MLQVALCCCLFFLCWRGGGELDKQVSVNEHMMNNHLLEVVMLHAGQLTFLVIDAPIECV